MTHTALASVSCLLVLDDFHIELDSFFYKYFFFHFILTNILSRVYVLNLIMDAFIVCK